MVIKSVQLCMLLVFYCTPPLTLAMSAQSGIQDNETDSTLKTDDEMFRRLNEIFSVRERNGNQNLLANPDYEWFTQDAVLFAVKDFLRLEKNRKVVVDPIGKRDRRSSAPFITGDAFRSHCAPNLCEEDSNDKESAGENCQLKTENMKSDRLNKARMLKFFLEKRMPDIKVPLKLYTDGHGDQANPDGQLMPFTTMNKWTLTETLNRYHIEGKLKSFHAVNLHWQNRSMSRPDWAHCVPIGLENRDCSYGANIRKYVLSMKENLLDEPQRYHRHNHSWLLVPESFANTDARKPDRMKAFQQHRYHKDFHPTKSVSHEEWLKSLSRYYFVLAPHGHGLDTHRMMEILLMGSVPVIKRSTISSCYDDTDNVIGNSTRGSLPVVIVDSWSEVTPERLAKEWESISSRSPSHWDWRRIFVDHWLERLDAS